MVENNLVERHLDNWAAWQRLPDNNLGYPKRAMVACGGGQSVEGAFEEMCSKADRHSAEIVEALVNDLALNQRSAIYRQWLGCSIIIRDLDKVLSEAYDILARKINERGLV